MQKISLIYALLIFSVLSCSKEEDSINTSCGFNKPIEKIEWLNDFVKEYEQMEQDGNEFIQYAYILQAPFKLKTVFVVGNCCPNCLSIIIVRDCSGKDVETTSDEYTDLLEKGTVIWKAQSNVCTF